MKIHVIAVGKLKEKFWVEACAEYMKRLKAYAKVTIEEIPDRDPAKCGGEEGARKTEGKGILEALPEHSHVILLDVGGKYGCADAFGYKRHYLRGGRIGRREPQRARFRRRMPFVRQDHASA